MQFESATPNFNTMVFLNRNCLNANILPFIGQLAVDDIKVVRSTSNFGYMLVVSSGTCITMLTSIM